MQRIAVLGTSGSGKTTTAHAISEQLGLSHIELDAINWLPNWQERPDGEFAILVERAMEEATEGWVMCGGYTRLVDHLRMERADTIVWLDLSKAVVMWQVVSRTVRRAITREELWSGNHEPLRNFYRWDPHQNIIRWAWTQFDRRRSGYEHAVTSGAWDHLDVHRLRTRSEIKRFLADL